MDSSSVRNGSAASTGGERHAVGLGLADRRAEIGGRLGRGSRRAAHGDPARADLAAGADAGQRHPERELAGDQQPGWRRTVGPAESDRQSVVVGGDVEVHRADERLERGDALGRGAQVSAAQRREDRRVERLDRDGASDPRRQVGVGGLGVDRLPEPVVLVGGHGDRAVREHPGRQLSPPQHPGDGDPEVVQERTGARVEGEAL